LQGLFAFSSDLAMMGNESDEGERKHAPDDSTPWAKMRHELVTTAKILGGQPDAQDLVDCEALKRFLTAVVGGTSWQEAAIAVGYPDQQARRILKINADWLADQGLKIEE